MPKDYITRGEFNEFREEFYDFQNLTVKMFGDMREDMDEMQKDMVIMKTDITELKSDVAVLKSDVAELKSDVAILKADIIEIKNSLKVLIGAINGVVTSVKTLSEHISMMYDQSEYRWAEQRMINESIQSDIAGLKAAIV